MCVCVCVCVCVSIYLCVFVCVFWESSLCNLPHSSASGNSRKPGQSSSSFKTAHTWRSSLDTHTHTHTHTHKHTHTHTSSSYFQVLPPRTCSPPKPSVLTGLLKGHFTKTPLVAGRCDWPVVTGVTPAESQSATPPDLQ